MNNFSKKLIQRTTTDITIAVIKQLSTKVVEQVGDETIFDLVKGMVNTSLTKIEADLSIEVGMRRETQAPKATLVADFNSPLYPIIGTTDDGNIANEIASVLQKEINAYITATETAAPVIHELVKGIAKLNEGKSIDAIMVSYELPVDMVAFLNKNRLEHVRKFSADYNKVTLPTSHDKGVYDILHELPDSNIKNILDSYTMEQINTTWIKYNNCINSSTDYRYFVAPSSYENVVICLTIVELLLMHDIILDNTSGKYSDYIDTLRYHRSTLLVRLHGINELVESQNRSNVVFVAIDKRYSNFDNQIDLSILTSLAYEKSLLESDYNATGMALIQTGEIKSNIRVSEIKEFVDLAQSTYDTLKMKTVESALNKFKRNALSLYREKLTELGESMHDALLHTKIVNTVKVNSTMVDIKTEHLTMPAMCVNMHIKRMLTETNYDIYFSAYKEAINNDYEPDVALVYAIAYLSIRYLTQGLKLV